MIDIAVFNDTYSDFDHSVIVEIIDIYINEHAERLEELEKNVKALNFDEIKKIAHSLKGTTSVFFDDTATENANNLEIMGKTMKEENLILEFNTLKKEVLRLVEDLKILKKNYL